MTVSIFDFFSKTQDKANNLEFRFICVIFSRKLPVIQLPSFPFVVFESRITRVSMKALGLELPHSNIFSLNN